MTHIPNKTEILATRTTPIRKALYREQAARDAMRLSEWLRWLADCRLQVGKKGRDASDMRELDGFTLIEEPEEPRPKVT